MITGLVTVLAFEIISPLAHAHVYVCSGRAHEKAGAHIAMFDRLAPSAAEMAVHAAGIPAGSSHILGRLYQVNPLFREPRPGRDFPVGLCGVVANKAVYFSHIREIECLVFPSIADVTTGASGPVPIYIDTKIVDSQVVLTQIGAPLMPYRVW